MPDRIKGVYDALIKEGYTDKDLGGYDKFSKAMRDGKNDAVRRNTYSFLKNRGYSNLGDYDSYSNKLLEIDDVKANTQQKLETKPVDAAVSKPTQASAAVQQPQTAPQQPVAKQQPKQKAAEPQGTPMSEADRQRFTQFGADILGQTAYDMGKVQNMGEYSKAKLKNPLDVKGKGIGFNIALGTDMQPHEINPNVVKTADGKYLTSDGNKFLNIGDASEQQNLIDKTLMPAYKAEELKGQINDIDKQIVEEEARLRKNTENTLGKFKRVPTKFDNTINMPTSSGKLDALKAERNKLQSEYNKLFQSGTRSQVEGLYNSVTNSIDKAVNAAAKKHDMPNVVFSPYAVGGVGMSKRDIALLTAKADNPDVENLEIAQRTLLDAKNIINEADQNARQGTFADWWARSFAGGAARGLGQKAFDIKTWDFGMHDAKASMAFKKIIDKADRGEKLTEGEQALLDAKAVEAATNAYFGNEVGRGYKAGSVTGESLPFMLEMAINPAAGVGKGAQAAFTRYMIKRFGSAALKRSLATKLAYNVGKYGVRALGDIAGSSIMAATTGSARVTAEANRRMAGDAQFKLDDNLKPTFSGVEGKEDAEKAWLHAFSQTAVDNFTEMEGFKYEKGGEALAKMAGKFVPKSVKRFLEGATNNEYAKMMSEIMKRAQFHGTIGEYMEEKEADALNIILGNSNMNWGAGKDGFFNPSDNLDTYLGVSLMGGAFGVMGAAGYRTERYNARKAVENAGAAADAVFARVAQERNDADILTGENGWRQMRNTLSFGSDEEVKDVLTRVFTSDEFTPEQRKAVAQYAGAAYKMRGIKIAEAKAKAGGDNLMSAYDEGRSLSTAEEMNDARNMYEYRRKQAAEAMGISEDELDAQTEQSTPEMYLRVAMQQGADKGKAVEKYINSKARFDGMIDGLRDNINDKANEAEDAIRQNTNRSMEDAQVVEATLADGTHGYIVSGVVDVTEDGKVNTNGTADFMTMRTDDGKIIAVAPSDIETVSVNYADALIEQARAEIEEQESTAAEANIENGGLNVEQGAPVNFVDDSGQVVNAVSEGVTQTEDGQTIVSLNVNGQSIQMPLDALRGAVDRFNRTRAEQYARQEDAADIEQEGEGVQIEQGQTVTYVGADDTQYTATVMTEPDADGYVEIEVQLADGSKFVNRVKADKLMQAATAIEGKPTTTAQTSEEEAQLPPPPTNMTVGEDGSIVEAQQPTEEQTRVIDRIPSHEANGTKVYDWEKAAPEDTYDALVETFGSMADKGVENSIKDIDKQLKAAEKALQKVEGMTIEQMMANPNAIADAQNLVNALNERKKYWESVKNVPTARAAQAEEERKKKEAENSLPPLPENVTIGEDGSLQAVEDNEEKVQEPTTEATPVAEEKENEPTVTEEPTEAAPTAEESTAATETEAQIEAAEKKNKKYDFSIETEEEFAAFEKKVRDMSDEELLDVMRSQGFDETKADHPSVYDEYDYRHDKEYTEMFEMYMNGLNDGSVSREQVEEMLADAEKEWKDGGFANDLRTQLNAQIDACREWLEAHLETKDNVVAKQETGRHTEEAQQPTAEKATPQAEEEQATNEDEQRDAVNKQVEKVLSEHGYHKGDMFRTHNMGNNAKAEIAGFDAGGVVLRTFAENGKQTAQYIELAENFLEMVDNGYLEPITEERKESEPQDKTKQNDSEGKKEEKKPQKPTSNRKNTEEPKERLYENGGIYIERETTEDDGAYEVYSLHNGDAVQYCVPDSADKRIADFKKPGEESVGTAYNAMGDYMFRSLEEAKEIAEKLRKRDAANAEYQKKVAEKEKAEAEKAEAEKERKRYGGFTDGKSPMQAANIAKVLDKLHNFTGYGTKAMYKHIEDWAKTDGVTFGVEHVPGKKTPEYYARMKDGSEFLIPKTAYDYARFVGGKMMGEADIERSKKDAELQSLKQKYSKYKDGAKRNERIARLEKALKGMNAPDLAKELADLRRLDELMGEAEQNTAKPSTQEKAEETAKTSDSQEDEKKTEKDKGKGKKPTAVKGKKIEDVGEKIGGARKDIASEMSGKINLNADTFPKMFPKFDLQKLVEKGLDPKMAAAVMFLRQEAMKVFKSKKKRSGTAEALSAAKFFAAYAKRALEEGNTDVTFTDGRWMFTEYGQASIKTNIELYGKIMEKMGTDMLDLDLSDYHIDPIGVGKISGVRHYAYRNDGKGGREQFEPHYTAHAGRSVDYLKEDERDKAFEFVINKLEQNVSYKNAHPYSLSVYRQGSKYFVGTRISGEIEHLTEDFDNLKDANEYLNANEADLQVKAAQTEQQKKADKKSTAPVAKLEFKSGKENRTMVISVKIGDEYVPLSDELKDSSVLKFYREHKDELQKKAQQLMDEWFEAKQKAKGWKPELSLGGVGARSGEDYRHGRDIDAEELHNTFGFRGIEFGNYVSQKERQKFLNETYDALMDLSTLLGISPKAIGLGGELGFAIGARGLGAKSGQAHYEPTYNVINLTKKSGAGALAHEWWHALDFFMNREGNTRKASATSVENAEGFSNETRKEMRDAFMHLMETIKGSEYYKRSKALEHRMHPDRASNQTGYFDQPTELGARAFQDYVQRRLMEKGVKNDFLSTFTPEESWNGEAENYPYPTGKDAEKIAEAIDNVFSTIQERTDEDGKAILYHKAEGTAEGVSERDAMLRDAVVDKLREAGIEVVTDTEEAQRILDLANGEVNEHRVYHGTGADFDAFDHSHMGEGEGNQSFGWGTYVTEVEGIGRGYAKRTGDLKDSEREFIKGKIEEARKYNIPAQVEYWENELKNLGDVQHYLYEVEIPEDNGNNYVEWDKAITDEQVSQVKKGLINDSRFKKESKKMYNTILKGISDKSLMPPFDEWIEDRAGVSAMSGMENGQRLYNELITLFGSDKAASEFLKDCGFVGIKYPAEALSGGREDGAKNFVIFDENNAKITDKVRFFRTENGEAYGFVKDGKIYLDPRIAGAQTAVHEYTHLWAEALRQSEPEKWKEIADVLQNDKSVAPLMEQVKKNYPELSGDDLIDELLAHYSGKRGAERLNAAADEIEKQNGGVFGKAEAISAIENVKRVLNDFWKKVAELLGFEKKFKNADEVADMVLNDLLSGSAINTATDNKSGYTPEMQSIKDEAIADGTFMKAPNGNPTNLNERQWLQVRTKNFINWFGDWINDPANASKVVDENGEPLVVYHNSQTKNITVFKSGVGNAIFFADAIAQNYVEGFERGDYNYAVFLNIKNPHTESYEAGFIDEEDSVDGVFVSAKVEEGVGHAAIVKNPNQIKSATDNVGTYSRENNDIRYERAGFKGNRRKQETEEDAANTLYSARELVKARQRINSIGNIGKAGTKAFEGEDGKRIFNPTVAKNIGEYMVNALQEYKDWLEFYAEDSNATKAYKQRFADHIAEVDKAIEFYNELKDGKITDPEAIYDRDIRYREIGAPLNPRGERMTAQNTSLDEAIAIQGSGIRYSTRVNHNSPFLLKRADGSFVDAETGETLGFDHRFMGTGEGAQVHGWGSYFSANDIRRYAGSVDEEPGYRYKGKTREDLDDENITEIAAGIIIDKADLDKVSIEQAKEALIKEHTDELDSLHKEKKEQRRPASVMDDLIADETNLLKGLTRLKVADFKYFEPERHHYDVEIPDNNGTNYIEEKEPLSEKTIDRIVDALDKRLRNTFKDTKTEGFYEWARAHHSEGLRQGQNFRDIREFLRDSGNTEEEISNVLHDAGFVGIHYDGRKDGECYVIFDGNDAKIVNHERFRDAEETEQNAERDEDAMERDARAFADELGTRVRVVRDVNEIEHPDAATQNRMRESLGWFDPKSGEVVVVIPNNTDAADVRATVLHEIVGHKGLQQVVGKEKFEDFLMKVYRGVDVETRKKINEIAARNHWDFYEGIEEYIAQQAERGFEDRENAGLWRKIVQYVRDLLSEAKVRLGMNLGENDVRYMLWKTYQLKKGRRGVFAEAKDVALQNELGVGNYGRKPRLRTSEELDRDYPNWNDTQTTSKGGHSTQITGTVSTYRKIGEMLKQNGMDGVSVLDASSGKGVGTEALRDMGFDVDDVEPYAPNDRKNAPTYDSYDKIDKKYDVIISNAVLNVIPDDWRADVLRNMAAHLADGGMMIVNTRGVDEAKGVKNKVELDDASEILISNGKGGFRSYQKFYNHETLAKFIKDTLGDGYVIEKATKANAGFANSNAVVVRKADTTNGGGIRFRDNGGNAAAHPDEADNTLRGVALEYNKRLGKGSYQAIEAVQDSMRSLLEVQRILEERSGKPLEDWENAYMAENAMSSRNNAEYEAWKRDNYKPLTEAVRALMESEGLSREGVEEYLYMKHGIERNREMSVRAAISEKAEREGKKAAHAEIRAQRDAAKQNGTDFKEPTDTERKRLEKQKEAEMQKQLRNDWKQKRDEIRKQYPNDWEKAQRELDKAATMVFGADLDAREYSGLTAIMSTDDVADARTRAYDAVKQLMEDRPQECKALDEAVHNAASITLEKPFRSGLIDRATFDDISDMYEYYIPLRGFSETTAEEVYNYLRGDAGHGYSEPIKRAKGRMSQAESPLTYLVQMAQSALVQGNRNIMKQRFYNMALRRPSDLITVSEAWVVKQLNPQTGAEEWVTAYPQIKPEMSADEVEKAVADFENDMMQREAQGEAFKTGSKKGDGIPYRTLHDQLAEHQVIVKRAGREYVLTVNGNPRLAQAINGKTNPNSNYEGVGGKVKKALDDTNRKLSQLYTTANPDFVVSNLMRDTAYTWSMALIKEDAAYAKSFIGHWNKNLPKMWSLYKKLQHNTLNMNDPVEREFKNFVMNGGETGYSTLQELEDIKAELDKDLAKGNVKKFVESSLNLFDRANRSVENLARFSAYLASRDAGRTVERSVYDAKEISVNFNKKGAGGMFFGTNGQTKLGNIASSMSAIGRGGYIFWNAGVQGMANISKIAKRNPKKFAAGAAVGFALGFILAAMHGDDDDDELGYGDLPDYVRRSNIVIGGSKHYFTAPLPVEYRTMYGMGELAYRVLSGNEKYTNAELAEKITSTITQALPIDSMEGMSGGGKWYSPLIPSYAKPLAEVAVNSDWTGKPIYYENEWNKRNPEWTKVNENTTNSILFATSKMLNEWTGGDDFTSGALDINPAIVEHLAQGYLGGLMTFGNRVMKTGETLVGARDYDSRNIPFANRGYKQPTEYTKESRINSEYRKDIEDMRELKQKERGYRQKAAEGNAEYAEKYRELVRSREYRKMLRFENLYKQVKKLNDDAGGDERAMKQVKRLKKDAVRVMDNEN